MSPETRADATELRILITEDSSGNLDVKWAANLENSPHVVVPLRASHVAGQLHAASLLILAKAYQGILGDLNNSLKTSATLQTTDASKSSEKHNGKKHGKKT